VACWARPADISRVRSPAPACRYRPSVAIASFVLSIVAIVVAGLSALYTRRQAVATAGVHEIERSRRLDERRPRLSAKIDRLGATSGRLVVTLESDEPLSAVELAIPEGQGVTFNRNVVGVHPVRPGDLAHHAFTYDPLLDKPTGIRPRESASWAVDIAEKHVGTLRLDATCPGMAGESWGSVLITARVEPDMGQTVF